jgi:hypothetical protein
MSWNRACYGANSASRILTGEGRIRDIVNNYRKLNFSVAPALLDELARSSPNVYRRIQEADALSVEQWGHGNAMARPWQEVLLPLLPPDRAALQIDWGLTAFEHHFGRPAEGFCLPHDAVNPVVLDLLVNRGLKFLLLSPFQAEGLMPAGAGSWQSLAGAPAPGDRPFRIDRPEGSLAVFFPDEALSRGLVQDHLLRDSSLLEAALRRSLQATGFINVAAPGETFGVSEPFADMCLAALWDRFDGASPVDCGNYGLALERHPPRELVKLKKGEDEEGSSADCPHGVARWHRECGCRSSSSRQTWKAPLWERLTEWERVLTARVDVEAHDLGIEPSRLREEAPRLLLGVERPRDWARRLLAKNDAEAEDRLIAATRALQWLQGFLSGSVWNGDDPTAAEARGGFLAALRTFDFIRSATAEEFLASLASVAMNDGRTVGAFLAAELMRRRHDPRFAAALLLLDRLLRPRARYEDSFGPLNVADFTRSRHEIDEGVYRYTGQIRLQDSECDRAVEFEYLLLEDHREGVSLYLKDADSVDRPQAFDLEHLPMGDRMEIVQLMGNDLEANLASETQTIFPLLRKSLVYARLLDVPPLPMARSLMELAVTRKILGMTENSDVPGPELMEALEEELSFAKDFTLTLDAPRLNGRFSRWLAQALGNPSAFASEEVVRAVETLLAALGRWGFSPDLTVAQSLVFEALRDRSPQLFEALGAGRIEALQELKRLLRLGTLLWLDTSALKNRLFEL